MTYDYYCDECDRTVEVKRSIHDADNGCDCRKCGLPMRKLLTPPLIQFKGNGFYSTDK